jgi:hypothetical protein
MEDEPERLELLDRGFDGQGEGQALGRVASPERLGLLASSTSMEPRALLAEPGDQRGSREDRHRADPTQSEAGQACPDIGVGGEQPGRTVGQERRLTARWDDDRAVRGGGQRRDRGGEPGAGDPGAQ